MSLCLLVKLNINSNWRGPGEHLSVDVAVWVLSHCMGAWHQRVPGGGVVFYLPLLGTPNPKASLSQRLCSWGSLCAHPLCLVLESCLSYPQTPVEHWGLFCAEDSFCTDYSFITGRKLVTVQWRMVADGHHFSQAIRVNIIDSTSLLVGDTEDPMSLEWHVCPRCIFKI